MPLFSFFHFCQLYAFIKAFRGKFWFPKTSLKVLQYFPKEGNTNSTNRKDVFWTRTMTVHSFRVLSLPNVTALEKPKVYVTVYDSTEDMRKSSQHDKTAIPTCRVMTLGLAINLFSVTSSRRQGSESTRHTDCRQYGSNILQSVSLDEFCTASQQSEALMS